MDDDYKTKSFSQQSKTWSVSYGLCKSCGLCIAICPQKCIVRSKNAVGIYEDPSVEVEIEKCISCGQCELICPEAAIKVSRKK